MGWRRGCTGSTTTILPRSWRSGRRKTTMMHESASEVHLVVNTNRDQGIVNARLLGEILGNE